MSIGSKEKIMKTLIFIIATLMLSFGVATANEQKLVTLDDAQIHYAICDQAQSKSVTLGKKKALMVVSGEINFETSTGTGKTIITGWPMIVDLNELPWACEYSSKSGLEIEVQMDIADDLPLVRFIKG